MSLKRYLLSLPERVVRSTVGVGAGVAREVGDVIIPKRVRQTQLYSNLVDGTLRFLIEQVGDVGGVYPAASALPDDFLTRRAAGNAVEVLGVIAFRASPVWVLAALADVSGIGRQLIPEIAAALKAQGLLDGDTEFTTADQMLDGLERTCGRMAATINTPPLDVAALRDELNAIRAEARTLQPSRLPSAEMLGDLWATLKDEAARQNRTVFETSSMMAVAAVRSLPDSLRWLTSSARVGATRTGEIMAAGLLDHYRTTLAEIRETGYTVYATRHLLPYLRAAVRQFSPRRRTLTEKYLLRPPDRLP